MDHGTITCTDYSVTLEDSYVIINAEQNDVVLTMPLNASNGNSVVITRGPYTNNTIYVRQGNMTPVALDVLEAAYDSVMLIHNGKEWTIEGESITDKFRRMVRIAIAEEEAKNEDMDS